MTTKQVADRLVALCRQQKWETAQQELYADDAVSIEPHDMPGFPRETKGKAGILEKGRKFVAMLDQVHSYQVGDPIVAGNAFACATTLDATFKGQPRMQMSEVCVYVVKDGRIVSESFFM